MRREFLPFTSPGIMTIFTNADLLVCQSILVQKHMKLLKARTVNLINPNTVLI